MAEWSSIHIENFQKEKNRMLKKSMIVLFTLVFTVSVQMVFSPVTAIAACNSEKCGAVPYSDRKFGEFSREMRERPNDPMRDGLELHGNYCGPGHGENHGDPIDILDGLCQQHDNCYAENGYFSCSCDAQLVKGIYANISEMGVIVAMKAVLVAEYFTLQMARLSCIVDWILS